MLGGLRDAKAFGGAGEGMEAESSSSRDWGCDYWERKYSLGQQALFSWIWELDHCSTGLG